MRVYQVGLQRIYDSCLLYNLLPHASCISCFASRSRSMKKI